MMLGTSAHIGNTGSLGLGSIGAEVQSNTHYLLPNSFKHTLINYFYTDVGYKG